MTNYTIKILDAQNNVRFEKTDAVELAAVFDGEYQKGDKIQLSSSSDKVYTIVKLDDCMDFSFTLLSGVFTIEIPFDEKKMSYNPKAFTGSRHYLYAREALPAEISVRKNLALNVWDCHENTALFPHTSANVETRGESVFASRNAIDGLLANTFHGEWPYSSWGINKNPQAELTLDFGRKVKVDEVVIYLRADFPHDAWWTKGSITFSDGSELVMDFEKRGDAQSFRFPAKEVTSLKLHSLIKADDPSPFPALTQIEVYGTEA
ncbi:discoidin domain-containing protein [Treponema sp.]|uniref:discoidin domain-containing protein n=1 Tax=Treponema sp. TaxID=166 RepID=UPI0025E6225A|nr:discoidin domain-containing protein [Treponema sp.]MCR5219137.1 discoidin domain-containing protein [Treponema sp.]